MQDSWLSYHIQSNLKEHALFLNVPSLSSVCCCRPSASRCCWRASAPPSSSPSSYRRGSRPSSTSRTATSARSRWVQEEGMKFWKRDLDAIPLILASLQVDESSREGNANYNLITNSFQFVLTLLIVSALYAAIYCRLRSRYALHNTGTRGRIRAPFIWSFSFPCKTTFVRFFLVAKAPFTRLFPL